MQKMSTVVHIPEDQLPSLLAFCKRYSNPGKMSEIIASPACASSVLMKIEAIWNKGLHELNEAIDLAGLSQ